MPTTPNTYMNIMSIVESGQDLNFGVGHQGIKVIKIPLIYFYNRFYDFRGHFSVAKISGLSNENYFLMTIKAKNFYHYISIIFLFYIV